MKKIILIAALCAVSFLAGSKITEPCHVKKMEYAFRHLEYLEPTDSGLNIYDDKGNLYIWK